MSISNWSHLSPLSSFFQSLESSRRFSTSRNTSSSSPTSIINLPPRTFLHQTFLHQPSRRFFFYPRHRHTACLPPFFKITASLTFQTLSFHSHHPLKLHFNLPFSPDGSSRQLPRWRFQGRRVSSHLRITAIPHVMSPTDQFR